MRASKLKSELPDKGQNAIWGVFRRSIHCVSLSCPIHTPHSTLHTPLPSFIYLDRLKTRAQHEALLTATTVAQWDSTHMTGLKFSFFSFLVDLLPGILKNIFVYN